MKFKTLDPNNPFLAKWDSDPWWANLLLSFSLMNVHREEKQYNTGTISPLNKNLLKTRCLVAIWQTLHPEEGLPSGMQERHGWLCCMPASEPNGRAGRERWSPEHLGGDTLWALSAPNRILPQLSSCPMAAALFAIWGSHIWHWIGIHSLEEAPSSMLECGPEA